MARALLLNATYQPLCVVSARRAVVLVLRGKAEALEVGDESFRSERATLASPTVVRLHRYVRVPYRTNVPLTRRAVFARDCGRCQYCARPAENIDHVVPKSRGGRHSWDNVVACCRSCNSGKEDRLLSECGLQLRRLPVAPAPSLWIVAAVGSIDPSWCGYLGMTDPSSAAVAVA